ncbi:MAG TPA: helicase, partial [Deltaproteobacteria bacterium]|nr:helicase [Deltaproteobacteria bacterium]
MSSAAPLPIESLRSTVLASIETQPVVVSAPTGSGKSTQIPRWLRNRGRVLVVEPRRVAARALATRVAELESVQAGREVGWVVRDEARATERSEVVFVTPGIALRWAAAGRLTNFQSLVFDEFHERGMDLDLLLALCVRDRRMGRPSPDLLVMSATLAGDRIAEFLQGVHHSGDGRLHPVEIRHQAGPDPAPSANNLESRVLRSLESLDDTSGDILVFLPGKAEIERVATILRDRPEDVLPLHGGLSLQRQRAVFRPGPRRRIILSTNVAETSLTIPRIGVVIDSGLVRRTRYRNGRAHLTLLPIARDSADQRSGRAGRLGPGVAIRLWKAHVRLDARTPPEIHRDDLGQLVLAAAACGAGALETLPFLDPPKPHAVADARQRLEDLDALDRTTHAITTRGTRLFGLPVDAHLGRLLVESQARGTLELTLPLAAALSTSRPLLRPGERRSAPLDDPDPIFDAQCDATAMILAVCSGRPRQPGLDEKALSEARTALRRFCSAFQWDIERCRGRQRITPDERATLARTLLAAWPRCAHIQRRHGRRLAWANGGTELSLGRNSVVDETAHTSILLLDSRAFTPKPRRDEIVITAAMPVPPSWLVQAGRGRDRVVEVRLDRRAEGGMVARIERVYAGRALAVREEMPTGSLARDAIVDLLLKNALMGGIAKELNHRHERASLARRLEGEAPLLPLREWLQQRLETLELNDPTEL